MAIHLLVSEFLQNYMYGHTASLTSLKQFRAFKLLIWPDGLRDNNTPFVQ